MKGTTVLKDRLIITDPSVEPCSDASSAEQSYIRLVRDGKDLQPCNDLSHSGRLYRWLCMWEYSNPNGRIHDISR